MSDKRDWNAEVIAEFRANRGEVAAPYPDPPPMLVLHTIGARSGKEHVVPMRGMPDGEGFYVFATAHGNDRDPDWIHNLVANPEIVIERGTETFPVRAALLDGSDRERILAAWVERVPLIADVLAKTSRQIPVVRLSPAASVAHGAESAAGSRVFEAGSAPNGHETTNGGANDWLAAIENELRSWPGVQVDRNETGPGGIGVTVYRLGRSQIGHVHDNGAADFLVPRVLREELIATGRAVPHPAFPDERTVVSYQMKQMEDVSKVLDLFRLNRDRLRAARDRHGPSERLADGETGAPDSGETHR